jgi:predicted DNA binding CopG/RHH family protein
MKIRYVNIRVSDEDYNAIKKAAKKQEQGNVSHFLRRVIMRYVKNINLP